MCHPPPRNVVPVMVSGAVLIVLGGPVGAYQERDYPFLADELHLLERRLAADLLPLEICLGRQLMAHALGARVFPGRGKAIGWAPLQRSQAARRSCLAYLAAPYAVAVCRPESQQPRATMSHGLVSLRIGTAVGSPARTSQRCQLCEG
jgi:GMP synthase-like glutamine amidotransferase